MNRFIVAEVSKNWLNGVSPEYDLLAQMFERLIEHQRQRGYFLHSWEIHRMITGHGALNETIIAVFEEAPLEGKVVGDDMIPA